jgi:hypothetical protein
MVKQAVVLTKVGLWYKQMLEARRSELQKAEAKVFHIHLVYVVYLLGYIAKHTVLFFIFRSTCGEFSIYKLCDG